MKFLNFLHILSTCFMIGESYKILALFPMPSGSHYKLSSRLVNALAAKGHKVTVITPFLQNSPVKNLEEISVESLIDVINKQRKNFFSMDTKTVMENSNILFEMSYTICEEILKHENVQKLLKSQKTFDVVILPGQYLTESLISIAHHFKAPAVLLATMPLYPWYSFLFSYPAPSSYVPHLLSPYRGHMNFWQRAKNTFYDISTILYHQWFILPKHRELVKKHMPGHPDLYDFVNNVSLVLINSHVSTYEALPMAPNAIEIGGLHIEPEKLPEDLQKFLDDSTNGVVLFSLGSNLKSADLPKETKDGILRAFAKLKQNVLWKWEEDELPGQPNNVKIMKWLPQSDILAHPNVKAVITHGGLLSTMENVYFGIPMIGIPVMVDQKMNMAIAVSNGYAISISLEELNEEILSKSLNEVLNGTMYKENIQKRSKLMRDRPMKPVDTAIYWIEYVVRHQGASHLRYPGMNLTWFQRYLVDVAIFVLAVAVTTIFCIFLVSKKIVKGKLHDKDKKYN